MTTFVAVISVFVATLLLLGAAVSNIVKIVSIVMQRDVPVFTLLLCICTLTCIYVWSHM